jgi:hypothetical protein
MLQKIDLFHQESTHEARLQAGLTMVTSNHPKTNDKKKLTSEMKMRSSPD